MLTKTLAVLFTALVVTTAVASTANAYPNSPEEQNWFEIPQGRDEGMPSWSRNNVVPTPPRR